MYREIVARMRRISEAHPVIWAAAWAATGAWWMLLLEVLA